MLKEYFATLGLDALKDSAVRKTREHFNQVKLQNSLEDFFVRQEKINLHVLPAEEIDFAGLIEYLRSACLSECKEYLFGNRQARRNAERTIRTRAKAYSKAQTNLAGERAERLAMQIVGILKDYYTQNCSDESRFVAGLISQDVEAQLDEQSAEFRESFRRIEDGQLMSVDKNVQLIRQGAFEQVEANLATFTGAIKAQPHLVPGYAYETRLIDNALRIVSVPQSEEALRRYPPMFKVNYRATMGGVAVNDLSSETFAYSRRHQVPIEMQIFSAEKFLGTFLDPRQYEAEALAGKTMVHTPEPFPPATAYQLRVGQQVVYEYIELRTKEVEEDGTVILTNDEQKKCAISICIKANPSTLRVVFGVQPRLTTTKELLKLRYFYRSVCEHAVVTIHSLTEGEDMISGVIDNFRYEGGEDALKEEIDFLEKIEVLEDYYQKEIDFPEQLHLRDLNALDYLVRLIRKEEIVRRWTELSEDLVCSADMREKISRAILAAENQETYNLGFQGPTSIPLWNETYELPITRIYQNARLDNPAKIEGLLKYLEDGDLLSVKFFPADESQDSVFTDVLDASAETEQIK